MPDAESIEVNPAEVNAFLGGDKPDLSKGVELKMDPTLLGQTPASPQQDKSLPQDATFDAKAGNESKVVEETMQDGYEFRPEQIALTDEEKEAFLGSVMTDQPARLRLTLPGLKDVTIDMRTRNTFEQSAMLGVLDMDTKAGRISSPPTWLTWMQYYALAFQLVRFGQKTFEPLSYETPQDLTEIAPKMRAYVEKHFLGLPVLKAQVLVSAARLLDAKLVAAGNMIINRDFSQPAG